MSEEMNTGRAWVFGDNIDTDVLAPGHYMKLSPKDLSSHCLEAIDPSFAGAVKPGDFVVAGRNFGLGSSREQAAVSLKLLGVGAVLAPSFARIFYRNALNLGLPALFFAAAVRVKAGDKLQVDAISGTVNNLTQGWTEAATPIPAHLMNMISAGGLINHLRQSLTATQGAPKAGVKG
jgi:3-isopropylmalate/(R)-2-methylmalate dehydratase small subunit